MMVIGMNLNHQNSSGMVAIVAIGNTFYAIVGTSVHTTTGSIDDDDTSTIHEPTHPTHTRNIHAVSHNTTATTSNHTMIHDDQHHNSDNVIKIISFQQSSQVYPVIVLNLYDRSLDPNWHSIFLASGRECAVVDVYVVGTDDGMNYYSNNATTTTTTTTTPTSHDGYSSSVHCSKPRNGIVTVTSPILSAASSYPYIVILQSDGLISIRSSSCLAISLRTIEVGQRPNDYFTIRTIHNSSNSMAGGSTNDVTSSFVSSSSSSSYIATTPYIVAVAYSGECKVIQCQPDTAQDLADRCMRHAIDAFGTNGFPRMELAEAINASFTATSYVNPNETSTSNSRILLKQYLEAVLGLTDFEGGGSSGWPTELLEGDVHHGAFATGGIGTATTTTAAGSTTTRGDGVARSRTDSRGASYFYYSGRGAVPNVVTSATPTALLTGTALLCLVCSQLVPVHSSLANRAAKVCSEKIGIVFDGTRQISKSAISVCELVAEKLLKEASSKFSLGSSASPTPIARVNRSAQSNAITDFLEASIWLLRSCGKHERAIEVAYERLQQQGHQQQTVASTSALSDGIGGTVVRGFWSQIKYESYTATHLSDIWSAGKDEGCQLVLSSPATRRLLERNPRLGLSVFTAMHPQNEAQWRSTSFRDDPLSHPGRVNDVLNLFKTIHPFVSTDKERSSVAQEGALNTLPLESGLAIAVSFVRSAIGISTGRPVNDDHHHYDSLPIDADLDNQIAHIHDKLSLLLLEGTIVERSGGAVQPDAEDNELGQIYRSMLREFLQWPLAKIRPEEFMEALPSTFLQEKALVLGRLGQHEDALRILYGELNSLDLALAYCDHRYSRQKQQYYERNRTWQQQQQQHHQQNVSVYSDLDAADDFDMKGEDNAYVPLIRIALESHDTERGTATAIKVLALRRGAVDRTAALKLLPADVPVSAVARPFLIPALVESESQVRRMTVVSALLRSRYLRLKEKLTTAQLKAQANIHIVVSLKSLNLGDPIHSTKATRARTTSVTPGATMPYIEIIKHFFQRHLVIQAKVTNSPYSSHSSSSVAHYSDKMGEGSIHNRPVLSDVSFVVAESSEEEAIMPLLQVPIQLLPPTLTGCAWCVLSASPSNMDAPTAQLTCELRYSIQPSATTGVDTNFGFHTGTVLSRTFVEELQDIEIHAVHFLPKAH
jgi:Vam6/Vps39-like protein vacuolar protein sorting-associated protein 39